MTTPGLGPSVILESLIEPLEPAGVSPTQTLEPSTVVTLLSAGPSQCKDPAAKLVSFTAHPCVITDQIGRHDVLFIPINNSHYNFRENKINAFLFH